MFHHLRGTLIEKKLPIVVVEAHGIGYEIEVPLGTFSQLPEKNQNIMLYLHFVVREDAQLLYGFHDTVHRDLFRRLIRVSGIGPKVALSILSGMDAYTFSYCIQQNALNDLVKIPGIGKKTAERLMIEMRDQGVEQWLLTQPSLGAQPLTTEESVRNEALAALLALGYRVQDVKPLVQAAKFTKEFTSEALIRQVLQTFMEK